jgi:dUTP pyrophosphatase
MQPITYGRTKSMNVKIKVQNKSGNPLPQYKTPGSAGMDLYASRGYIIRANHVLAIETGLYVEIPTGYEGQVRSRSGLSLQGLVVNNAPGTIDSDFRGEIKVILRNQTELPVSIKPGDRIAQLVLSAVDTIQWDETIEELSTTQRGTGGFGSTGIEG